MSISFPCTLATVWEYVLCVCMCVLCQYEQDDGGHCQESQQYNDHNTHTSPQRIVLHVNRKETWLPCWYFCRSISLTRVGSSSSSCSSSSASLCFPPIPKGFTFRCSGNEPGGSEAVGSRSVGLGSAVGRGRRRGVGGRMAPAWGSPAVWRRRLPTQPTVLLLNCRLLGWWF